MLEMEIKSVITDFETKIFSEEQLKELRDGEEKGVNIYLYKNVNFTPHQMREIKLGLMSNVDITLYAKPDLTAEQMEAIRVGLQPNLVDIENMKMVFKIGDAYRINKVMT